MLTRTAAGHAQPSRAAVAPKRGTRAARDRRNKEACRVVFCLLMFLVSTVALLVLWLQYGTAQRRPGPTASQRGPDRQPSASLATRNQSHYQLGGFVCERGQSPVQADGKKPTWLDNCVADVTNSMCPLQKWEPKSDMRQGFDGCVASENCATMSGKVLYCLGKASGARTAAMYFAGYTCEGGSGAFSLALGLSQS